MKQVVWTIRPSFSSVKMIIVPTAGILLYFCLFIGCYRFIDDTNLIVTATAAVYTNCCLDLLKRFRDGSLNSHFVVGCIIHVFGGTSEGFQRCCFKHHARRGCEGHHHRRCTTHRCERGAKTLVHLIGRHLCTQTCLWVTIYGTLPHPRMQSVSDYRRSFSSNLQQ